MFDFSENPRKGRNPVIARFFKFEYLKNLVKNNEVAIDSAHAGSIAL